MFIALVSAIFNSPSVKQKLAVRAWALFIVSFSLMTTARVDAQGFPGAPMTRPPSQKKKRQLPDQKPTKQMPSVVAKPKVTQAAESSRPVEEQSIPIPPTTAEKTQDTEEAFEGGLYFQIFGAALFSPTGSTHGWTQDCPSLAAINWNPECTTRAPIGGTIGARLGFRYKWIGVEFFGLGAGDWSSAAFDQPIPNVPSIVSTMQIGRVGGGPGGGLRILSPPGTFRFSGGVGAGAMFRYVFTSFSSLDGSSVNYQSPFLVTDLNLMIGPLNLGLLALLEFSKDVNIQTKIAEQAGAAAQLDQIFSPIRVFSGTQFFLGPVLGLHFGN